MRFKNLQHGQLSKSVNEISQIILDNGLQAVLGNQIQDLNLILQKNEYLSNEIDVIGQFENEITTQKILTDYFKLENSTNLAKEIQTNGKGKIETEEFHLNFQKIDFFTPLQLHDLHSAILILATDKPIVDHEADLIRLAIEDYQWIIALNESHFPQGFLRECGKFISQLDLFDEKGEASLLDLLKDMSLEKKSIFQTKIGLKKINKVLNASSLLLKQEIKNSKSKKNLIQQKVTSLGDGKNFNSSEIIQSIKNIVSQYSNNYDKSLNSSYEQFLNLGESEFIGLISSINDSHIPLSENQKMKNIELGIEENYLKKLYIEVERIFLKRFNTDLSILLDSLNQLERDIEAVFKKHNFIYQKANIKYLTESDFQQILHYIRAKKPNYNGTAPLKGIMEYFSAARKFQMTFFMFLSMFGVSSLIRQYQYISIPVTVILLGIGIMSVYKNVNKERVENEEKEQQKAHESLTSYMKDVAAEIQRYWIKTLIDHFKSQLQTLSFEIENQLKVYTQSQISQTEEERKRNQRLISTFEQNERKLDTASRNIQPAERNLQRMVSDLENAYSNLLRSEREERRRI